MKYSNELLNGSFMFNTSMMLEFLGLSQNSQSSLHKKIEIGEIPPPVYYAGEKVWFTDTLKKHLKAFEKRFYKGILNDKEEQNV